MVLASTLQTIMVVKEMGNFKVVVVAQEVEVYLDENKVADPTF